MYVFGYGSLVNDESRQRTCTVDKNDVFPVRVSHLQRTWSYPGKDSNNEPIMYLNVKVTDNSKDTVNGTIFKITDEDLEPLSKRELQYTRITLNLDHLTILNELMKEEYKLQSTDVVYTYSYLGDVPKLDKFESYHGICKLGFKQYGDNFLNEFIATTYDY